VWSKIKNSNKNVRLKNGSLCMRVSLGQQQAVEEEEAVKPKKCSRGSKAN